MSNTTQNDKEYADFIHNFLPKFAHNIKFHPKAKITPREFIFLCKLSPESWENFMKGDHTKSNFEECYVWQKKWRRKYTDFWDFKKAMSEGKLKRD